MIPFFILLAVQWNPEALKPRRQLWLGRHWRIYDAPKVGTGCGIKQWLTAPISVELQNTTVSESG